MNWIAATGFLLLAGCIPEEGPMMSPGEDCLTCHQGGEASRWSVAGTVYPGLDSPSFDGLHGATVTVTDATGRTISLLTNLAGNFYLADPLTFPLSTSVAAGGQTRTMGVAVAYGGCNSCHRRPGRGWVTPFAPPSAALGPDG